MIDNKKFDELFHEKPEYLIEKTQDEIKDYILKSEEKLSVMNLILKLNEFSFLKYAKSVQKMIVYFAIYDKDSKEYLEYSTYIKYNIQNEIDLPKNSNIVKKIDTYINSNKNLTFKFLAVPVVTENEDYILSLEKYFYKSSLALDNEENQQYNNTVKFTKSMLSFLYTKVLPLFILVIIPTYIYVYLIKDIGLVDSLIDISIVTTTVLYVVYETINLIKSYLFFIVIGFIVFIPIFAIANILYNSFLELVFGQVIYFIMTKIKKTNESLEHNVILEKIKFKRSIEDVKLLFTIFKSLKYYYVSLLVYTLVISILFLIFFISQISNIKNDNHTFISLSAQEYIQHSAFPKLAEIDLRNSCENSKIVLFMGYDKTYSYYYDLNYINSIILESSNENFDKFITSYNNKIEMKYLKFQDIFKYFLIGKLDNSKISAVKNDMYDFHNIYDFKVRQEEFFKIKQINLKE